MFSRLFTKTYIYKYLFVYVQEMGYLEIYHRLKIVIFEGVNKVNAGD